MSKILTVKKTTIYTVMFGNEVNGEYIRFDAESWLNTNTGWESSSEDIARLEKKFQKHLGEVGEQGD